MRFSYNDTSMRELLECAVQICQQEPNITLEALAGVLITEHGYWRLRDDDWMALLKETVRRERRLPWEEGQELVVAHGYTVTHDVPHGERVTVLEPPDPKIHSRMYVVRWKGVRQFLTQDELEFPFADLMGVRTR